jgi:aryl-alcohol dehydrogenase-like predicted oxidoreductase
MPTAEEIAMEHRAFGRTGLAVSAVGFGSWPMSGGDRYGAIEDAEAIRAIHRAVDGGVNCVDTAPAYGFGHAEEVVGQALRGRRGRVILVTKCGLAWDPDNPVIRRDTRPASLKREVDLSLRRLQTDVIDVYLIHWPNADTPFEDAFGTMDDIVRAGKVRFVGVSNFTAAQMEACMRVRRIDVIQVGYHLFDRRMEQEVFPYCASHGIGVMGYGPLGHGLLTGTFNSATRFADPDWRAKGIAFGQPIFTPENLPKNVAIVDRLRREVAEPLGVPVSHVALAWVLRNPVVSTALIGARNPAEVEANLRGAQLTLSGADGERIDAILADAAGTIRAFTPLRPAMERWE